MTNLVDTVLTSPKLGIQCDIPGWDDLRSVGAAVERCRREHCELYGVLWHRADEWEVSITADGIACRETHFDLRANQGTCLRLFRLVTHDDPHALARPGTGSSHTDASETLSGLEPWL